LANVRDPRRHFNNLIQRYNEENEHIEKLSNLVQQSMWRELREEFQVICGDNFKRAKKQGRIQAAVVIQSAIRAYLARKAAAILSDQRKMYHAVQMFIKEISALKHVDDANALQFLLHHNNVRASADDTKFKEALRQNEARQIIQRNKPSQNHATAKLDADVAALRVKRFSNNFEAQQEIAAPKYDSPHKAIHPQMIASPKATNDSKSIMPASVSTPVQERGHLLGRSNCTTPKTTGRYSVECRRSQSGEDSSALLSPFLEMPMDNTGSYGGYISPPSQGHTLSRSLSASFGKVFADMIEEKEDDVDVYNSILRDLQNGQSPVSQYVDEALVANTGSYDEVLTFFFTLIQNITEF
jgi:RNA polymerase-interacting CarD/CdnL/TRCF family regulator